MMNTPEVKCPYCDNTDLNEMEMVEDCQVTRDLVGYDDDGCFRIESKCTTFEQYADNQRFCCKKCNADFPIPDDLEITYT